MRPNHCSGELAAVALVTDTMRARSVPVAGYSQWCIRDGVFQRRSTGTCVRTLTSVHAGDSCQRCEHSRTQTRATSTRWSSFQTLCPCLPAPAPMFHRCGRPRTHLRTHERCGRGEHLNIERRDGLALAFGMSRRRFIECPCPASASSVSVVRVCYVDSNGKKEGNQHACIRSERHIGHRPERVGLRQ